MIIFFLIAFWDYSYNLDVGFGYDDNVYAYSQPHIDDFLNGVRPYRFPFEAYDDLVTGVDFNLLVRNKFFGKRTTTFSFSLNTDNFLINNQKNYQKYTFGLRQSFSKFAVKLSYGIIPNYLIRYYRNPQGTSTDYMGCEAAYHTISGKISFTTIQDITLSAGYSHKWDNYIEEFNRYDASGHIVSFGLEKKIRKYLDFDFGYTYRTSENDSADVITSSTELTPDGSFYQHFLSGNIKLQSVVLVPTVLKLSYNYAYRNYTASSPEDSLHFGRQENRHRAMISIHSRVLTGAWLKLYGLRQWRSTSSEVLQGIGDIKDYVKYKAGAGLEFYY
ncbi:MAG: hypothetical protein WBE28_02450 [bacterium]